METTQAADAVHAAEKKGLAPVISSALRQTWWLGLGILATIGEKTARVAAALVEKGREVEPSVVRPVRNATAGLVDAAQPGRRLDRAAHALRSVRVPAVLRGASSPTKEQFEELAEEVRSLRKRLASQDNDSEQG